MNIKFIVNVIKARFKTSAVPSFWAAFGLLMLAVLALGFIFNRQNGLQMRVGVLRPQTERTEKLLSHFETYAEKNCDIAVYESAEQMKMDVSANKLECAYIFDGEKITAYRSPWTAADKILDLMVAAVYTEGLAGELGADVLDGLERLGNGKADGETDSLAEKIQARADEYLKDGALMETVYVEVNGGVSAENETSPSNVDGGGPSAIGVSSGGAAPYYRLFHGLTGAAGLLLALLFAMGLSGETEKSAAVRLQAKNIFSAAGILIVFAMTFVFILAVFTAGNLLFPGVVGSWPGEILTALAFAFALAGIAILLSVLLPSDVFPAVIPFIFIFAVIFGGAVFDIREVFEAAAPVRYLFPNYYFMSGNIAALFVTGFVCGTGAAVISRLR